MPGRLLSRQAIHTHTLRKLLNHYNSRNPLLPRHLSTTTGATTRNAYRAIVVGAGPAGIATVGKLVDHDIRPILWIDRKFDGGRLNERYREVPSNTKVSLFLDFARECASFREIVQNSPPQNAFSALEKMEQGKGCKLGYAADLCVQLSDGISPSAGVTKVLGRVEAARLGSDGMWNVKVTQDSQSTTSASTSATTPLLILATGCSPIPPALPTSYPHLSTLPLDIALSPAQLSTTLPTTALTIAVIGASHSAILILRNLFVLSQSTHPNLRVKWFSRHPLRYAIYHGDWIEKDNTGLKGEAAAWARENLEPDVWDERPGHVGAVVQKVFVKAGKEETEAYERELPGCGIVCEAVGFAREEVPVLGCVAENGSVVGIEGVREDGKTGTLVDTMGEEVKGLKGVGIAWPERVVDKLGNEEVSVGMWKFMKYLNRVVPEWVRGSEERAK